MNIKKILILFPLRAGAKGVFLTELFAPYGIAGVAVEVFSLAATFPGVVLKIGARFWETAALIPWRAGQIRVFRGGSAE